MATSRMLLFLGALGCVAAWDDLILPPLTEGKTGDPAVLLFGQGAGIDTSLYQSLGEAIQAAAPFPLWFGSPQCMSNSCAVPGTLKSGMERIKSTMVDQGLDIDNSTFYYGGHSLGGAMMPDYVHDEALDDASGMVLMGSFLTRKWRTGVTSSGRPQYEFPVPTLTIGGELDGLCRITRIAEALYTQVTFAEDPEAAGQAMPVTVIPGMNHYQFASGNEPPVLVAKRDLKAEISEEDAHAAVAADTVAFLTALRSADPTSDSWDAVAERQTESTKFVAPQVAALQMEGYAQFLPPCLCETPDEYAPEGFAEDVLAPALEKLASPGNESKNDRRACSKVPYLQFGTCADQSNCTGGCPWTSQHSMGVMGGGYEEDGLVINNVDSLHIVTEECPSCHLPHIHGGGPDRVNYGNPGNTGHENNFNPATPSLCTYPFESGSCTLNTTSVTQHVYDNSGEVDIWRISFGIDSADTGFLPLAATELRSKLKSRQAVYEAAGIAAADPAAATLNATDLPASKGGGAGLGRCAEINQAAVDWATSQLSETAADRFEKYGQKIVIGADLDSWCGGGPCWIWDSLKFKTDDEAGVVNVQAVGMVEENYNKFPCGESHEKGQHIPCPTGFHYCKLLSPAKALEWMTVDGLRLNYRGYS